MKIIFTRLTCLIAIACLATGLSAQVANTLEVTSPAEIAGKYPITVSNGWGVDITTPISGDLSFADDGEGVITDACDGTITNVAGFIAVIDRGDCDFVSKALAAQGAGAVAALICNNVPGDGETTLGFDVDGPFADVVIPVMGMNFENCQTIRTVGKGVTTTSVDIYFDCENDPVDFTDVIWGTVPGEGDFLGGLNGWSVESFNQADTSWAWETNLPIPGLFTGGNWSFPTACNGFMAFPTDFYDTNSLEQGSGICPNSNASPCVGELTSPIIPLDPDNVDGLVVRFAHAWRNFQSTSFLIATYDEGVTWADTIEYYNTTLYPTNISSGATDIEVPLPGWNGEPTVQFKFNHQGAYYYYGIDDVRLVNKAFKDLQIFDQFFATAPVFRTPINQLSEMVFHCDIFNIGNLDFEDVRIQASITAPDGTTESFINDTYATQPGFVFLNENNSFTDTYTPPEQLGVYRAEYSNVSDGDTNDSNDRLNFVFEVTEDTYETCNEVDATGDIFSGLIFSDPTNQFYPGEDLAIAYSFYQPTGCTMEEITFGVLDLPSNSGSVNIFVYQWNIDAASTNDDIALGDYIIASADTRLVGVLGATTTGDPGPEIINPLLSGTPEEMTVKMAAANPANGRAIENSDGSLVPLELEGDKSYVVVFAYDGGDSQILMRAANADATQQRWAYNTSATNFALDTNQINRFYGTTFKGTEGNDFSVIDGLDFDGSNGGGNFGTLLDNNMPWIRMKMAATSQEGCTVGTEDVLVDDSHIDIYPNPVLDVLNVSVAFDVVTEVAVEILDISGKVVFANDYGKVTTSTMSINTNNIPSGIYNVNIRTQDGFTTKRVVVQK